MTAKFITLEGIEGVGKSTNTAFIVDILKQYNIPVYQTREPGGTKIAEQIRQVLLGSADEPIYANTELLLMFAARSQHINHVILPTLKKGTWVVCDRFTDASFAYQGGGRGMDNDKIKMLASWVQNTLTPDITFLLDAPVNIGSTRIKMRGTLDRFEQEKTAFFERVRDNYLSRAKESPRFKIIDASQPLDAVQQMIITHLKKILP